MTGPAAPAGPPARFAVVGAITRDTVVSEDGLHESVGGILYNAVTLGLLAGGRQDRVELYAYAGQDVDRELAALATAHPALDITHVRRTVAPNVRCYLMELHGQVLAEVHRGYPPPLSLEHVLPAAEADAVLVTFPLGYEMTLPTWQRLRERLRGLCLVDYHTLSLGTDAHGTRYWRRRSSWPEWLAGVHTVQLNQDEAEHLAGRRLGSPDDYRDFARPLLGRGCALVLVTRGARGAVLVRGRRGTPACTEVAGSALPVRSTIGCGDVFSAAFLAAFLRTGDAEQACSFAAGAAGAATAGRGVEALPRLLRDHTCPGPPSSTREATP